MKKVIDFLKHPLAFPVIAIGGIYLFWLFSVPMNIFGGDENFGNYLAGLIIFGIYIFIIVIECNIEKFPKWTPIYFLTLIFIDFYAILYVSFFLYEISEYGWPESKIIFATGITLIAAYPAGTALLKLSSKNGAASFLIFIVILPILGANIAYPMNFYPRIQETLEFGKYKYYIASSYDWDFHSFEDFYKCQKWTFNCRSLYGSYSLPLGPLIIDEQKQEISLLGFGGSVLLYTDGENPRSYTAPAAQFEDHIYQISEGCNDFKNREGHYGCGSYTYILYECNLDYKSCDTLPIQYTTEDFGTLLIIEGNEETKEINIYSDYPEDGGVLIFTSGENPRCYVEGCEILKR